MNYDTKCMGVFHLQYNTGSSPVLTSILIGMKKIKLFLKKMVIAFFETISHH